MPSNSGSHGTVTDFQIGHDEIDLEGFFSGARATPTSCS
jgi:hypothetical protein